jgi:hypothetical protein
MTPWTIDNPKLESQRARNARAIVAGLLVVVATGSIALSPMSMPLFCLYAFLAAILGSLCLSSDKFAGGIGLLLLYVAVQPSLIRHLPEHWSARWWQPGMVVSGVVSAMVLVKMRIRRQPQDPASPGRMNERGQL